MILILGIACGFSRGFQSLFRGKYVKMKKTFGKLWWNLENKICRNLQNLRKFDEIWGNFSKSEKNQRKFCETATPSLLFLNKYWKITILFYFIIPGSLPPNLINYSFFANTSNEFRSLTKIQISYPFRMFVKMEILIKLHDFSLSWIKILYLFSPLGFLRNI